MNAKERAIEELNELNTKIKKLEAFISDINMPSIGFIPSLCLVNQLNAMKSYAFFLGQRIENWQEIKQPDF